MRHKNDCKFRVFFRTKLLPFFSGVFFRLFFGLRQPSRTGPDLVQIRSVDQSDVGLERPVRTKSRTVIPVDNVMHMAGHTRPQTTNIYLMDGARNVADQDSMFVVARQASSATPAAGLPRGNPLA